MLPTDPLLVKSHAQLVGEPAERSVNRTVSGMVPDRGVAENAAAGADPDGADTVI